ncbi:ABC transporter permease [Lusitaniella coriacea]|uniref:ABC transporter permease n=1 Tax=Lusitaniella coriacea TaxID=1983105 RepID=UPI003CF02D84
MGLNVLDRLGDSNPQLFRELKGRLKPRNAAIAIALSLFGQLLIIFGRLSGLNRLYQPNYGADQAYCRLRDTFTQQRTQHQEQYERLQGQFRHYSSSEHFDPARIAQLKDNIERVKGQIQKLPQDLYDIACPADAIDIQRWWNDFYLQSFVWLSVGMVFVLLVVGTYLLIDDLGKEERRDTLNFVRLSPQSTQSILVGKILGVPSLVYLAIAFALPLYIFLGLSAQIPLAAMLSFWAIFAASCAFFFSAALGLGLIRLGVGGFKPWLGGGALLLFLVFELNSYARTNFFTWVKLFAPFSILGHWIAPIVNTHSSGEMHGKIYYSSRIDLPSGLDNAFHLEWFNLPISLAGLSLVIFALLNYILWTGWIWQALNRRFRHPHATLLSKRQSYWLLICMEVVQLGLLVSEAEVGVVEENVGWFVVVNVLFFLGAIALLAPHRQAVQDWMRYRRESHQQRPSFWKNKLVLDLIEHENSPIVIAMAINLAIACIPFAVWALFLPTEDIQLIFNLNKLQFFFAIAFFISLVSIVATLAQLILMMRVKQPAIWAVGVVAAFLILPGLAFGTLGVHPREYPTWFLFSTIPWAGLQYAATSTIAMALLANFGVLALLNLQLVRQLRAIGASEFKTLAARDRDVLKIDTPTTK